MRAFLFEIRRSLRGPNRAGDCALVSATVTVEASSPDPIAAAILLSSGPLTLTVGSVPTAAATALSSGPPSDRATPAALGALT